MIIGDRFLFRVVIKIVIFLLNYKITCPASPRRGCGMWDGQVAPDPQQLLPARDHELVLPAEVV